MEFTALFATYRLTLASPAANPIGSSLTIRRAAAFRFEFASRWALHILPMGFVRVRYYGGMSHPKRREFITWCRQLLGIEEELPPGADKPTDSSPPENPADTLEPRDEDDELARAPAYHCPRCGRKMDCLEFARRPSWRITMNGPDRPAWYEP